MPVALFISPHLDDVAFSCGGTLAGLSREGWEVHLHTVFAASVPDPQGFALRCQTDKGIPAEVDYLALRREEDREFARLAGVAHLGHDRFPEAPHRGYESPEALFAGEHAADRVWEEVAAALRPLADRLRPDRWFGPQGRGGHVDHLQVIRALRSSGLTPGRGWWYADTPYVVREPRSTPSALLPGGLVERVVDVGPTWETKLAGCRAYGSQVGFQFGGAAEVAARLDAYHRAVAARAAFPDGAQRAEEFLVSPAADHPA